MRKTFAFTSFVLVSISLVACESKPRGFALDGSPIRYETKTFTDPSVLAQAGDITFTKDQILDKSPVLKDLAQQENDALIGMAYLHVAPQSTDGEVNGTVEIFLPSSETSLEAILQKYDRKPVPGLEIEFKDAPSPNLIARFGGRNVTYDDIDRNHVVLKTIEQSRFRETASQLNGQLARILLNDVASKKKMTLQDFVAKEVLEGKPVVVSDAELKDYFRSIGLAETEVTEELRPRFHEGLRVRKEQAAIEAYVAKNVLKGPVSVGFSAPRANFPIESDWKPVDGYSDAPVTLIAFGGATCNDCPALIDTLDTLMKRHDGHLKLYWIHNFNPSDGVAQMVAEAAHCVSTINPKKSFAFMKQVSATGSSIDEKSFFSWAGSNGVDESEFKSCFLERRSKAIVEGDLEYARRAGVVSNPTLWIDGMMMQGSISPKGSEQAINDKIAEHGSTWFQAFGRRMKAWFSRS